MRRLLLDLGNTKLKAAWRQDNEELISPITDSAGISPTLCDVADEIWLSSVAPAQQTQYLLETLPCPAKIRQVTVPAYQHHLPTRYASHQLGVDRWLAMLACCAISPGPSLVADFGTAITLDLINSKSEHIGGYLLPGLTLMQQSIIAGTAINAPSGDISHQEIAQDTISAIALGSRQSVVALIEKMLKQAEPQTQLFIGGGDARVLAPYLASSYRKEEFMVLKGLARLADLETQ